MKLFTLLRDLRNGYNTLATLGREKPGWVLGCFFVASVTLAGCGARPGVGSAEERGGGPNDGGVESDAGAPGADGGSIEIDAGQPEVCDWAPGKVYQLTEPPYDKRLHTVSVTATNVLVAWQISNSDPPSAKTRNMQKLTFDGEPEADVVTLFPSPGGWNAYGGIRIATGPDHFGAAVWDEANGCMFRPLDTEGDIIGDFHRVADLNCGVLRSTRTGFSLFTWDWGAQEKYLVRLDEHGVRLERSEPIAALSGRDVFWWSTTVLSDDELLVASMIGGLEPTEIEIQRIDNKGGVLSPPSSVVELDVPASRVRVIKTPAGALLGWLETAPDGPSHQHQHVVFQALDHEGVPYGEPTRHETRFVYRDAGWSLARWDDQVLASFVQPIEDDPYGDLSKVLFQPFTPEGQRDGSAVELGEERFARDTLIRRTPLGAIIVYTAYPGDLPHELFAGGVLCR